ncbi:hypothetical protein GQ44DRAFT_95257 [Phaeosphaeriaceae sp. PMI808]|nr:hypothetical protein GQ44DRAFT_95257 [Phaeosphaeriaceae sp. PMI808]
MKSFRSMLLSPNEKAVLPMDGNYHVDPCNPMNMVKYLDAWYPPGISEADMIWGGNTAKLVRLADGTVLKYVWDRGDDRAKNCLDIEHSILSMLGSHERVVKYLGKHEYGLRFQLATNGDIRRYLSSHEPGEILEQLRRKWAKQAAGGSTATSSADEESQAPRVTRSYSFSTLQGGLCGPGRISASWLGY